MQIAIQLAYFRWVKWSTVIVIALLYDFLPPPPPHFFFTTSTTRRPILQFLLLRCVNTVINQPRAWFSYWLCAQPLVQFPRNRLGSCVAPMLIFWLFWRALHWMEWGKSWHASIAIEALDWVIIWLEHPSSELNSLLSWAGFLSLAFFVSVSLSLSLSLSLFLWMFSFCRNQRERKDWQPFHRKPAHYLLF